MSHNRSNLCEIIKVVTLGTVDAVTDRRTEAVTNGRLEAVLLRSFDVATEGTTETVTNGRLIMKEQSAD